MIKSNEPRDIYRVAFHKLKYHNLSALNIGAFK